MCACDVLVGGEGCIIYTWCLSKRFIWQRGHMPEMLQTALQPANYKGKVYQTNIQWLSAQKAEFWISPKCFKLSQNLLLLNLMLKNHRFHGLAGSGWQSRHLRVHAQTIYCQETWLSASAMHSRAFLLVFCRSLGFLVPRFSSLIDKTDLAKFACYVWRRRCGGGLCSVHTPSGLLSWPEGPKGLSCSGWGPGPVYRAPC